MVDHPAEKNFNYVEMEDEQMFTIHPHTNIKKQRELIYEYYGCEYTKNSYLRNIWVNVELQSGLKNQCRENVRKMRFRNNI